MEVSGEELTSRMALCSDGACTFKGFQWVVPIIDI